MAAAGTFFPLGVLRLLRGNISGNVYAAYALTVPWWRSAFFDGSGGVVLCFSGALWAHFFYIFFCAFF